MLLQSTPEYSWVARHTWQSWRERYKKNAIRLDRIISRIVDEKKPIQGEKGQYGYVRQPEEKPKRIRKKKANCVDELLTPGEYRSDSPTATTPGNLSADASNTLAGLHTMPVRDSGSPLPKAHLAHQANAAEEEETSTEDEDSSEWAVRIGNAPPPAWATAAKRKASDDGNSDAEKRPRSEQ